MKSKTNSGLRLLAAALSAIGLMLSGCNTTGCTDNRSSIPLAGFYSSSDHNGISLDSLAIKGVGAPVDTIYLLEPGTSVSQVYLPLRASATSTTFEIIYRYKALDGLTDLLTLDYEAYPYFASEECGAMYRYRIRRVTHTLVLLDSVSLVPADSIITNAPTVNMHLYFRTSNQSQP